MTGTTSLLGGCRAVVQAPGDYVKLASLVGMLRWQKRMAVKYRRPFNRDNFRAMIRDRYICSARVY